MELACTEWIESRSIPYDGRGSTYRFSQTREATRYGLDGPGIESRPGRGVDHPPSSSARVKEGVEL